MKKIFVASILLLIGFSVHAQEWTTYQRQDGSSSTYGPGGSEYHTYQYPDGSSHTFGGDRWNTGS